VDAVQPANVCVNHSDGLSVIKYQGGTSMNPSPTPDRQLANYFARRLDHLRSCSAEVENRLIEEPKRELCEQVDRGEIDRTDAQVRRVFHHIEYVVGNTLRYTLLVGLCSFLEEALKVLTAQLVSKYESLLKKQDNGSWLVRHRNVLAGAGIDLKPIEQELDTF